VPITRLDETELLTALHSGLMEPSRWATFLARLRGRTRADYVGMFFSRDDAPPDRTTEIFTGRRPPAALKCRYPVEYRMLDPIPYAALRSSRVYNLAEFLDLDNPDHRRFQGEYLEPSGFNYIRVVRVIESQGASLWLLIARDQEDFDASDGSLLNALTPHLSIALQNTIGLERERMRAAIPGAALDRLRLGWLALDTHGRVTEKGDGTDALLAGMPTIRHAIGHRLQLGRLDHEHALTAAIAAFAHDADAAPRAILVSEAPRVSVLLQPTRYERISGMAPGAVAYIRVEGSFDGNALDHLAQLYSLSRGEAKLALGLCRGQSIAHAAGTVGITLESARTYSKRIYAKAGARGQSDLVRLVLSDVSGLSVAS